MAIVIYGPMGCGKSRNSERLRRHYRATSVQDDWYPGQRIEADLVLTNDVPPHTSDGNRWIPFSDAIRDASQ